MIPIDQTLFKQDGVSGNCMQAAVASLMEMPLEQVPHFAHSGSPEVCWDLFEDWFNEQGYTVRFSGIVDKNCNYLAAGPTVRGTQHMVVMHGDKVIHDPHPSRAGLLDIAHTFVLVPKC